MGPSIIRYTHKVLLSKKLILELMTGDFTIDEMRTNREMLYSDRFFNTNFDIVHDIRNAELRFTYDELATYMRHLNDSKAFGKRKSAILTNLSAKDKISEWYDSFTKIYPVTFKVFTSFPESMVWLNHEQECMDIGHEIETLHQATCPACLKEPNAFTGF